MIWLDALQVSHDTNFGLDIVGIFSSNLHIALNIFKSTQTFVSDYFFTCCQVTSRRISSTRGLSIRNSQDGGCLFRH